MTMSRSDRVDTLVCLALAAYFAASLMCAAAAWGSGKRTITVSHDNSVTPTIRASVGQIVSIPLRVAHTGPYQGVQVVVGIAPSGLTLPLDATTLPGCTAALGPPGQRTGLTVAIACSGPVLSDGTVGALRVLAEHRGSVRIRLVRCEVDERAVPCGDDVRLEVR